MAWPTFLLIGAAKSATTTIHALLDQHPDIYMSWPKEPGYWAFEAETPYQYQMVTGAEQLVRNRKDYEALFEPGREMRARGESSTQYLTTPGLAPLLRDRLPEVRLMVMLRHPVVGLVPQVDETVLSQPGLRRIAGRRRTQSAGMNT